MNQSDNTVQWHLLKAEADLGMFSMFGRTGAPTERGPPKARDCRTAAFECRKPCLHSQFR